MIAVFAAGCLLRARCLCAACAPVPVLPWRWSRLAQATKSWPCLQLPTGRLRSPCSLRRMRVSRLVLSSGYHHLQRPARRFCALRRARLVRCARLGLATRWDSPLALLRRAVAAHPTGLVRPLLWSPLAPLRLRECQAARRHWLLKVARPTSLSRPSTSAGLLWLSLKSATRGLGRCLICGASRQMYATTRALSSSRVSAPWRTGSTFSRKPRVVGAALWRHLARGRWHLAT